MQKRSSPRSKVKYYSSFFRSIQKTCFFFILTTTMATTRTTMDVDTIDLSALSTDASDFSSTLGIPSDESTEQFLNKYPLPVLFRTLESEDEMRSPIILALEKVFNTQFGSVALLDALPYAGQGLKASSSSTRRMTCIAIAKLLENTGNDEMAVQALVANDIVPPLLQTITDEDATVASGAAQAIQKLAETTNGVEILFKRKGTAEGLLKDLALHSSSLVRIRIFSIVAFLYKHSKQAVPVIKESGILSVLESELSNEHDVLSQMNALELLHEIALSPNGANFLTDGGLLQQLIYIMGNRRGDSFVRSQAMMIGAKLISPEGGLPSLVSKEDTVKIVDTINTALKCSEDLEGREEEAAIDAIGRIGMSKPGAEVLCESFAQVIHYVLQSAFNRKGGSKQLVSVHALASIAGAERSDNPILNEQAEKGLKDSIYSVLQSMVKWSLSDQIHWLLQQAYEMRLATYRLIVPLSGRSWFVLDISSNADIISYLTDPHVEQEKEGMEWRHSCCVAISTSLQGSGLWRESGLHDIYEKVQSAVLKGPYLSREKMEARPIVITQERF